MHFNHWWVNKVLWWRPNMVIVKIKKKLSDLGLRLLLCIIELSSFYFDWIVFWQRTKKNWSLKNSICWNHPYKHTRYICYKYSSPSWNNRPTQLILLGVLRASFVVQVLQDPCLYGRYMHERLLRVFWTHLSEIKILVLSPPRRLQF